VCREYVSHARILLFSTSVECHRRIVMLPNAKEKIAELRIRVDTLGRRL